jgi:uncharacterized membrane protein YcaP (DUF421 family)
MEWFVPTLAPVVWVIIATVIMYIAVLLLARWSGVRSFAELSVFDIPVTIAIGSLLASTVVSKDPPILEGLAALTTLYMLQLVVSRARAHLRRVDAATDNPPILLMGAEGTIKHENLRIARVTEDDLRAHLRAANVIDPKYVQAVVMEGTGVINVLHHHDGGVPDNSWILRDVRDRSR